MENKSEFREAMGKVSNIEKEYRHKALTRIYKARTRFHIIKQDLLEWSQTSRQSELRDILTKLKKTAITDKEILKLYDIFSVYANQKRTIDLYASFQVRGFLKKELMERANESFNKALETYDGFVQTRLRQILFLTAKEAMDKDLEKRNLEKKANKEKEIDKAFLAKYPEAEHLLLVNLKDRLLGTMEEWLHRRKAGAWAIIYPDGKIGSYYCPSMEPHIGMSFRYGGAGKHCKVQRIIRDGKLLVTSFVK